MFQGSPPRPSLFLPSSRQVLVCDVPHFQAHKPTPPPLSPPVGESFVTCHVFKLTNALLPLPPFQWVSPCLVMLCISKLTNLLLSLLPLQKVIPLLRRATFLPTPTSSLLIFPPISPLSTH